MIQVDQTFDGQEVVLPVDDTIEISLPENASTGHRWSIPPASEPSWTNQLQKTGDKFISAGKTPGKPGVRKLRFKALQIGDAHIVLEKGTVWKQDAKAEETFKLRVRVEAPQIRVANQ